MADDDDCYAVPGGAWKLLGYAKEEVDDNM